MSSVTPPQPPTSARYSEVMKAVTPANLHSPVIRGLFRFFVQNVRAGISLTAPCPATDEWACIRYMLRLAPLSHYWTSPAMSEPPVVYLLETQQDREYLIDMVLNDTEGKSYNDLATFNLILSNWLCKSNLTMINCELVCKVAQRQAQLTLASTSTPAPVTQEPTTTPAPVQKPAPVTLNLTLGQLCDCICDLLPTNPTGMLITDPASVCNIITVDQKNILDALFTFSTHHNWNLVASKALPILLKHRALQNYCTPTDSFKHFIGGTLHDDTSQVIHFVTTLIDIVTAPRSPCGLETIEYALRCVSSYVSNASASAYDFIRLLLTAHKVIPKCSDQMRQLDAFFSKLTKDHSGNKSALFLIDAVKRGNFGVSSAHWIVSHALDRSPSFDTKSLIAFCNNLDGGWTRDRLNEAFEYTSSSFFFEALYETPSIRSVVSLDFAKKCYRQTVHANKKAIFLKFMEYHLGVDSLEFQVVLPASIKDKLGEEFVPNIMKITYDSNVKTPTIGQKKE